MNTIISNETQLAFSVASNKGVYAVMLGSGVSRSAKIPTGWEVVLDLIRKVAVAEGENYGVEPEKWYRNKYSKDADYSNLLQELGGTPAERQQLLRPYFEPTTQEERDRNEKQPTVAHKSIAALVASGYIRVIVTTNFDRLMERALEDVGINPTVVSSADGAQGMKPLRHNACTIIKIHGDYMDTRIKNTPEELASYDPVLDSLLDQVADEYGLIVCGWSADYDPALCAAFHRAPNRRFTTYWAYRGRLGDAATTLIAHRQAAKIEIEDADRFFLKLSEGVQSLELMMRPHPLSKQMAVTSLKRYLSDGRRIELHDLIMQEVKKIVAAFDTDRFTLRFPQGTNDEHIAFMKNRVTEYEGLTETLTLMFATLCYWGEADQHSLIADTISQLGSTPTTNGCNTALHKLTLYPALLTLYSGGIAAVAAEKWGILRTLFSKPKVLSSYKLKSPTRSLLAHMIVEDDTNRKSIFGNFYVPLSEHLFTILRETMRDLIPSDDEYSRIFNRFEYIFSLACGNDMSDVYGKWAPPGRFGWMPDTYRGTIMPEIKKEIEELGSEWSPLKAGLFDGSLERLKEMMEAADAQVRGLNRW